MRRQDQYPDSAQMRHAQAHRLQHNSGMGPYRGREDALQANEHQYSSSKAEGQWQWNSDGPKGSNVMPSQIYKEGQGSDPSRSSYQDQRPDPKLGLESEASKEQRAQAPQAKTGSGYEDNAPPQTFESLEQTFIQDIMELSNEHQDAEDTENGRHLARLIEINTKHQEHLLALRAHQVACREEILRKESQARHHQYQLATSKINQHSGGPTSVPSPPNVNTESYGQRAGFDAGSLNVNIESYGQRAGFDAGSRGRGYAPRGRAHNSGGHGFRG